MAKFTDMLVESVIVQGILTLGLWGAIIYLSVAEREVPDLLAVGGGAILTFWFKTKIENRSR